MCYRQSTSTSPEEQPIKTACQFKYDMGWQKRGSGRAYDSKSGVGTLIGNRTGKICAYGVKNKDCRMCNFHINKGKVPPEHDCNRNWSGSSKAMEPSVAVDVIKEVESQNVEVSVLIMDDDATTMARIRDNISHPVQKWSDLNHTKKHLGNSLYSLQKKHKGFSNKCVQFIQKCFSYAVIQNKNKPEKLKSALCQIVPHAFGDHSHCESWCGYISNPETYRHKSLPHGKDLSGKELQEDLNNILSVYVTNAEKIAPAASTKDVESFNNVIASKAPKRIHYSGSSSLQNRVNCAVAEKNIGSHYVNRINTLAGISPGTIFKKYAERKDKIRKRRLLFENTREFKKQKLERKIKKNIVNAQCESREGVTYQSAVDLSDTTVVTEIPPAKQPLDIRKIELPVSYSRVYCDIETTSLSKTCEIVQIAAVSTDDKFTEYILPSHNIAPSASAVTGLHMQGNTLFYNGTPVAANPLQEALNLFLSWLSERKPCVLIGHNFKQFDFPRIIRALDKCDLKDALTESVIGIVDTLPLYREVCPGLLSYKQECLVSEILHECYVAHNAEEDVSSLQRLLSHTNPPDDVFVRHSTTVSSMIDMYMFDNETDANFDTLAHLVDQKVITRAIGLKIAKSGLQLKHLKFAYDRGLLDKVMLEKVNGKPRVTSTKRIIMALDAFFSRQNSNEMSSTVL